MDCRGDVSEKRSKAMAATELTIVRPAGSKQKTLPAFMYFHGGGWVLGDFPTHERLVRDLVAGSGAVAVFVNYSLSPEAAYGVATEQAYAATKWVAEHGKEINVDGSACRAGTARLPPGRAFALMANEKVHQHCAQVCVPLPDANSTRIVQYFGQRVISDEGLMVGSEPLPLPSQFPQAGLRGAAAGDETVNSSSELIIPPNSCMRDESEAYAASSTRRGL